MARQHSRYSKGLTVNLVKFAKSIPKVFRISMQCV